ncbi:general transcription factor II-I repeat domain-containing protein 2 [Trichonephila clavipes]|nr:general transcription factor II-I repeat domain-containing protein 2 [Trichonephila clavipes]
MHLSTNDAKLNLGIFREHLSQTGTPRDFVHAALSYDKAVVNFLHHESSPTWTGIEQATLSAEASRVDEKSDNLRDQHHSTIWTFQAYSIAIDESTDIPNIAQLAIFIRVCDVNLKTNEELLEVIPMHNTTTTVLMHLWKCIAEPYTTVWYRSGSLLVHVKSVETRSPHSGVEAWRWKGVYLRSPLTSY